MPWRFEDNEMSATDDSKESDSEDEEWIGFEFAFCYRVPLHIKWQDSTTYISAHQRRYLAVGELFGQQSGFLAVRSNC